MLNKLKNKWWLFTILSGVFAYLNPYFGIFSAIIVLILFFDIIMATIMIGHFNIFSKKISDKNERIDVIKKIFAKDIIFFKIMKLFTTVFMILAIFIIVIENLERKTILAPFFYISAIQTSVILQILCILLSIASISFSFILFWSYSDSYKQRLNELE